MKIDFGDLTRSDPTATVLVSSAGDVLGANAEAGRQLGLQTGANLLAVLDMAAEDVLSLLRACAGSSEPHIGALRFAGAGPRWMRCDGALVQPAAQGRPAVLVLRLRPREATNSTFVALNEKIAELGAEVQRRRRSETELERALEDKDVLLRELHHRVNNNLQTVASIFSLAATRERDPAVKPKLSMALARVNAMAAVQKILYEAADITRISLRELFSSLSVSIARLFGRADVRVILDVQPVIVAGDLAMPLGLIANELLTNAFKHAFAARPGRVWLRFHKLADSCFMLCVEDDGVGMPGDGSGGLGTMLIRGLTDQLGGELLMERGAGTKISIKLHADGKLRSEG